MQIILSVAKCIKSNRVFSKLPSCTWRTNNHWQPEAPLEKWAEPMGPKVCLHPKKAKLESLLGAAQGQKGAQVCSLEHEGKEAFPTFLPFPRVGIQ